MPFITVNRPTPAGTTRVRTMGGGTTGSICADGTVTTKAGQNPSQVCAQIYPAGTTTWPPNPPGTAVCVTLNYGQLSWWFDRLRGTMDVPGASCNNGAGVANVLVVWVRYPSAGTESVGLTFTGVCAADTDCAQANFFTASTLQAPTQMKVQADGFTGALKACNGAWVLGAGKDRANDWHTNPDDRPRLRLRLVGSVWQLTFETEGAKALYVQSTENWCWSRGNDLMFTGDDAQRTGAPLTVRVVAG